jgi:hypothetical protein
MEQIGGPILELRKLALPHPSGGPLVLNEERNLAVWSFALPNGFDKRMAVTS